MDLLALARRIANGDKSAWEQFVPSFYGVGRRSLLTFRFSQVDQDEILSQTLTKLYTGGLKKFRGSSQGELFFYLMNIVRNEAINFQKKQRREKSIPEFLINEPSIPSVEEDLADEECLRLLENIVQQLPFQDKELYLRCWEGLKIREIAEQMGEPIGTIGARISRLKDRIRKALRGHGC
jgi:RNA polymerase sigma-70 factor (ECF subfamily)